MALKLTLIVEKFLKSRNVKFSTFAKQRLRVLEREVNVNKSDFDVVDVMGELRKEQDMIEKLSAKDIRELGGLIAGAIK